MTELFERRAIVSGLGLSETGRRLDRSQTELLYDAILDAVADAGLTLADLDGLATIGFVPAGDVRESFDLELRWMWQRSMEDPLSASGGQLAAIFNACMAVATGLCRHVIVYRSVNMLRGDVGVSAPSKGSFQWNAPYRSYAASNGFAMHARRHMHLYGTTKEQLGWIALNCRYHAGLNESAVLRSPLTMDDYLNARPISDPLGLLDCDLPIDGAVALVISAADFAPDCRHHPVRFEAIGCATAGRATTNQRPDYPTMIPPMSAADMWSRTDLRPGDVDVAQLYDGFTILTIEWLEALGFCKPGEGGPFVEGGGRIRLGGALPLNTYGGQLSAGRLHGYWLFHEAVVQLRREAGSRQVPDADVAVGSAGAGSFGGCFLLTR